MTMHRILMFVLMWISGLLVGSIGTTVWIWWKLTTHQVTVRPLEETPIYQQRLYQYLRWFRPGRCTLCGRWTLWLLRSEAAHEACWLATK